MKRVFGDHPRVEQATRLYPLTKMRAKPARAPVRRRNTRLIEFRSATCINSVSNKILCC